MYTPQQREPVMNMAKWLGSMSWDIFSTLTYRYDVKTKQNFRIMTALEKYLKTLKKPFKMFWVTEFTNYNYNTHNHLLVKGDIVDDITYHLKSKSLIGKHYRHEPYEKEASIYVSKFICDRKINWNISENTDK
ncbi:MAG: hypothetical protein HN564_02015 [Flavobacteriales bacterium]|jgi:hypothetical protein|nr:hypothetical protein [Flavobacteriales bacterium]